MLTDHDITEGLAAAFHDRADPVGGTTVDPAGIFPRGVRARRRHAAVRSAMAGVGAALVAVVLAVNLSAGPGPVVAERPPGMLLAAAVVSPPPAGAAVAGMPRYYVTVDHVRPVAEVRASATGTVLSRSRCRAGSTRNCPRSRRPLKAAGSSWRCSPSRGPGSTGCASAAMAGQPG